MVVQEGRWQVRMYTGTEKLPGWTVRRGSGLGPLPQYLSAHWNQDHISQCSQAFSLRPEPVSYLHASSLRLQQAFSFRSETRLLQSRTIPLSSDLSFASSLRHKATKNHASLVPLPLDLQRLPTIPAPHQCSSGRCPENRSSGPGGTGPVGTSQGNSLQGGSPSRHSTRCH